MLGAPSYGLGAEGARNPHLRMRFLIRQRPRIYMPIVKMLALVAPWSRPGPRLHDKVVRLLEVLAVVCGIGVIEKLLAARAAHPSGDEASARDQIDLSELLGHPQRMLEDRQGIANQQDVHLLGK